MKLTFTITGSGTSQGIPVLGCDCEVCSSSDPRDHRLRTAAFIQSPNTSVAIDIGPDFRAQMLQARAKRLDAILITHEHNDHIAGLDDVRPFNFAQRSAMPIYSLHRVNQSLIQRFPYAFAEDKYPGAPTLELIDVAFGEELDIGDLSFKALRINHGIIDILGFRLGNLAYLTDAKAIPEETLIHLQDLDYLILDALHHRAHHSHLNLNQAIELAMAIGAGKTYFIHMSHLMGKHEQIEQTLPESMHLAFDGLRLAISLPEK